MLSEEKKKKDKNVLQIFFTYLCLLQNCTKKEPQNYASHVCKFSLKSGATVSQHRQTKYCKIVKL